MLKTTKKFIEELDELMNIACAEIDPRTWNEKDFSAFKKMMSMVDTSKELAIKQAETIEQQNEKLDKILKLLEKKA